MARGMKDSGIKWIGEIPYSWQCRPIKNSFVVYSGATPKSEIADYWDGEISWITPADFKTQDRIVSMGKRNLTKIGYASCGTTLVPAGSIVFSKRAPIGTVAIAVRELCTNQGCLSCVPRKGVDTWFFYYAMSVFTEQFNLYGTGTTFKEISYNDFINFFLPLPDEYEQHCIASFLDKRCAEIDSIIDQTRASIEEYKKLKQAVITQAVTKGIRPDRPMKDSGIEWIGEIPEDWEIVKFKTIITIIESGTSVNAAQYAAGENETGVLKTSCVSKFFFNPSENKAVNDDELHRVTCPVKADTIIMSRMNTPDLVGACGFVDKDYHNLYLPDRLWQIHFTKKANVKFLWYYLNSRNIRNYYASLAVGTSSSMQNISQDQFYNTYAMIPSEDEQYDIVDFLDGKIEEIDKLVVAKEQLVIDLESYKRSLIYEYVTGKKEVPVCQ